MGLLKDFGVVLDFENSQRIQLALKKIAVRQFLNVLNKYRSWEKTTDHKLIKWGQEIEGHFLTQGENGSLELCQQNIPQEFRDLEFPLFCEYGSWMFEMTPADPHNTGLNLDEVVLSIRNKYRVLQQKSKIALTIPSVPFVGVRNKQTEKEFMNEVTQSRFIDDRCIANHPRYPTMTKSVKARRGKNAEVKVPIFKDQMTDLTTVSADEPFPGHIYLDAMAFGLGMSCLQVTFSTKNLSHARYLHDQLHVMSPIFLALTAGTPFHKGKVADWDARWKVLEGSLDDRKDEERDPKNSKYLHTPRYSAMQCYVSEGEFNKEKFNDQDLNLPTEIVEEIKRASSEMNIPIDDALKRHLANLFKRDMIIVHDKFLDMEEDDNVLFELLNGTNWNSVRLKIPINDDIGWRVEFRTMEIMLTADENAAFSLIIHLITRAMTYFQDLNFLMPISLVNENFERAHANDALRTKKFYWRTNVIGNEEAVIDQLSIHEILFGKGSYKGLFNLMEERIEVNEQTVGLIKSLKTLLEKLTTGKKLTLAQYMRKFIMGHPEYKRDSILPKKVMDDLMLHLHEISSGKVSDENFGKVFDF